jgi:hypothetical protein
MVIPQDGLLLVYTHRQIFVEHGTNIYARRQAYFVFAVHLISKLSIPSRIRTPLDIRTRYRYHVIPPLSVIFKRGRLIESSASKTPPLC